MMRMLGRVEMAMGAGLSLLCVGGVVWLHLSPAARDPHGFMVFTAYVGVAVGLSILAGGALLRLGSPWRWIAQALAWACAVWAGSQLV